MSQPSQIRIKQSCKTENRFGNFFAVHIIDFPIKSTCSETGANSTTGSHIKWIFHLMPFLMLFTNIIIASTANSDLSTFDLLKMTYIQGHYKSVIV